MVYCKIKELLIAKGKTVLWLSKELDCSIEDVNKLIDNKNSIIYFDTIEKLCNILECTPNDIFEIIYD